MQATDRLYDLSGPRNLSVCRNERGHFAFTEGLNFPKLFYFPWQGFSLAEGDCEAAEWFKTTRFRRITFRRL